MKWAKNNIVYISMKRTQNEGNNLRHINIQTSTILFHRKLYDKNDIEARHCEMKTKADKKAEVNKRRKHIFIKFDDYTISANKRRKVKICEKQ